jgi:hypothetical protein
MPHLQIAGKLALALLNGSNIKVYFYVVVGSSAAESWQSHPTLRLPLTPNLILIFIWRIQGFRTLSAQNTPILWNASPLILQHGLWALGPLIRWRMNLPWQPEILHANGWKKSSRALWSKEDESNAQGSMG